MKSVLYWIFTDKLNLFDLISLTLIGNLGVYISPWLFLLCIPAGLLSGAMTYYTRESCTA